MTTPNEPGYSRPGSLAAAWNNVNALVNWPGYIQSCLWYAWRIVRYRDLSLRPLWLPASNDYTIREVQAEWRRLHIDSNILWMTNSGMMLLVSSRQRKWAAYVMRRYLAGNPVRAWENS